MPSSSTSCLSPFFRLRDESPLTLNSCTIALVVVVNAAVLLIVACKRARVVGLRKLREGESRRNDCMKGSERAGKRAYDIYRLTDEHPAC